MIGSLDQIISTVRWNSPFVVLLTYFVLKPSRPMWASSWDLPLLTSMCVWFKIIILQRPKHFQARAFDWDFEEAFIKHILISAHTSTVVLLICMKIRFSGWESVSHTGDFYPRQMSDAAHQQISDGEIKPQKFQKTRQICIWTSE